jgi:hypothetical protein
MKATKEQERGSPTLLFSCEVAEGERGRVPEGRGGGAPRGKAEETREKSLREEGNRVRPPSMDYFNSHRETWATNVSPLISMLIYLKLQIFHYTSIQVTL